MTACANFQLPMIAFTMAFVSPQKISLTSPFGIIASSILLTLFWILAWTVYRLYFSALSHIPGPPIAAVTGLYEFYYNCILGGKYGFEIERMHQRYGMSCSPWPLHAV